jgi:peptidyl-prolyl cis-trans isomerase D
MSIMETIRRSTDSTAARLVFGAIVLVFVFWGVGGQGPTSETYAVVNGERITDSSFRRAFQNVTNGSAMDDDEAREVSARVLDMLIEERVVLQEARDLGLEVSDEEVYAQLARQEAFKGPDGKFSSEIYERTLKRMGMTKGKFEDSLRESLLADKLDRVLRASVQVSELELKRRYEESATQVGVSWVRVPDAAVLDAVPVTDAAVQEYKDTRKDAIKAAYDREFNTRWSEPKRARISRIVLKTRLATGAPVDEAAVRETLTKVLEQARGGADFAELARRWSEDPATVLSGGEVGDQTAVQLGPVVGEAVFAAGGGAITDVLDTARGLEIVKVHSVTEAKVVSLEEATDTIARELVAKDGVDKFADELAESIRSTWASAGAPPADLLEKHGLSLSEPPLTSKAEPKLLGASDATSFVAAIKTATGEGVLGKVYQADDARVVGAIREYKKADLATWEQQKDMFMGIYARGRTQDFVQRWRKDAVARATVTDRKAFR